MSKLPDGLADRIVAAGALRSIPGLETRALALDQPVMVVWHDLPLALGTEGLTPTTATTTVTFAEHLSFRFPSDSLHRSRIIPFPALIVAARIGWVSGTVAPTATWAATIKIGTPANATKFAVKALTATDFIGDGSVVAFTATEIFDAVIDKDEVVVFKTSVNATVEKKVSVAMVIIARDPGVTS